MTGAAPTLIPVLAVENVAEALTFYSMLGFGEVFSIPDADGRLVHAHLRKDESVFLVGRLDVSHHEGSERAAAVSGSASDRRGLGATFILQVDNLAEIHARIPPPGAAHPLRASRRILRRPRVPLCRSVRL